MRCSKSHLAADGGNLEARYVRNTSKIENIKFRPIYKKFDFDFGGKI